ncbi:MAG: glycosyltransferase, partial [Chloroflexota bacterium]|nr:glycosyltransferase [Chloroflexota bacterium]
MTLIDRPMWMGGGERVAIELATRLDRERFESIVCASRLSRADETPVQRAGREALERGGVPLLGLERGRHYDLLAWRPFVTLLRRARIDVLHAHLFGSNFWGTVLGRAASVPVVVAHEHGWTSEMRTPARRAIDRYVIARWADAYIAVSAHTRQRMIEEGGIDAGRVVLIPNGIPFDSRVPPRDLRAELEIEPAAPVIGTVAVLRPEKELETLLEAAGLLVQRFPGLRVLIAGDGPERGRLEALTERLGLRKAVIFLGFRDDVQSVLATIDVAVFSSASEGSPLAVMEAMEAARPVVATHVGGVPDLIADGVHGFLVAPGDSAALARAVARAFEDPPAAAAMGARAHELCRREFDISVMVARIERLYSALFARSRRGRREGFELNPRPRRGSAFAGREHLRRHPVAA